MSIANALLRVLLSVCGLQCVVSAQVNVIGYLTDILCYDLVIALDGANMHTDPAAHTVHCMRDVQRCIDSGFAVMEEREDRYYIKYKFDAVGNDLALDLLKTTPTILNFTVNVTGTVDDDAELISVTNIAEPSYVSALSSQRLAGPAALYLHLLLMISSWGFLLPWGVSVASRARDVQGRAPGAWFQFHVACQGLGWLLQLLGFFAAVWYAQVYSTHFAGPHTYIGMLVVSLGTLQPINAAFRPHPDPRTKGRVLFEVVHKSCGWIAIIGGLLNIPLGIALAHAKGYDSATVGTAIAFYIIGSLPMSMYFITASLKKQNGWSRWLLHRWPDQDLGGSTSRVKGASST